MRKGKTCKREKVERLCYQGVTITPRPFNDQPATPHSFFKHSFDVTVNKETTKDDTLYCNGSVVVHQHANGLCVVTIGDNISKEKIIKSIEYCVQESPQQSAHERRKRHSKLLKGSPTTGKQDGITWPNTILARITYTDETILNIPAGVFGQVIELNTNITPSLLTQDALLDGYLAIILPTGSFPLRNPQDNDDEYESNNKIARSVAQDDVNKKEDGTELTPPPNIST